MDAGTLGVMIPIIGIVMGCGLALASLWTKHQQRIAEIQSEKTAEHTAEKAAQYVSQIQKLEDRVQVLERIVTDSGYNVATQIEALRDTRSVEQSDSGVPLEISQKEKA